MTGRVLGHGSYGIVQELEYMGLTCAGKKIHELFLTQGDDLYCVRRFKEECYIHSQLRHPNIVQFLGVHFQHGERVPTLVMEYLPTNLTSCIDQCGILPKEISYSILHDVALGLCYLHNHTTPIMHRDICSNNVLLTANMTAKISDLGTAMILPLDQPYYGTAHLDTMTDNKYNMEVTDSRMTMTRCPGTPAFMPPEVWSNSPKYDTSIDTFAYGITMIHMFSGRWPHPEDQRYNSEGELISVSEATRRKVYLQAIGSGHPLMDFILRCINNNPIYRPQVSEIVRQLQDMKEQFPASFANRLEMLRHIEQQDEKLALREEKGAENHQSNKQVTEQTDTCDSAKTSELETQQAVSPAEAMKEREGTSTLVSLTDATQ